MLKNLKEFPFSIFSHFETSEFSFFVFFKKRLLMSPDGFIALQFFDILQQNGCLKISKGPVFTFLALSDVSESSCLSDIEFFQYISIKNFILIICKVWEVELRKYCAIIRIFDGISETYCVLLRSRRRLENNRFHVASTLCSKLGTFSEHERHPMGVSKLFCKFFHTKRPEHI